MRKILIGAVAAGTLVGGSFAVAAVNPLGIAGAQDPPTTQAPPATAAPAPPDDGAKPDHPHGRGGPKVLDETLQELVAAGTITQAQADAIKDALKKKVEAEGDQGDQGGPHGPGGRGHGFPGGDRMEIGETAAAAIGIDVATLKSEIESGKSIAQVAQAHGVDPQKVIDALVAKAGARLDEAAAAGKIPADRVAEAKSELVDHITKLVNGQPGGGPGRDGKGHGPWGPKGHDDQNEADDQDDESTPTAPPATEAPAAPAPTTDAPTTPAPTTEAPGSTVAG